MLSYFFKMFNRLLNCLNLMLKCYLKSHKNSTNKLKIEASFREINIKTYTIFASRSVYLFTHCTPKTRTSNLSPIQQIPRQGRHEIKREIKKRDNEKSVAIGMDTRIESSLSTSAVVRSTSQRSYDKIHSCVAPRERRCLLFWRL